MYSNKTNTIWCRVKHFVFYTDGTYQVDLDLFGRDSIIGVGTENYNLYKIDHANKLVAYKSNSIAAWNSMEFGGPVYDLLPTSIATQNFREELKELLK